MFTANGNLLQNPNVLIGDTAATCRSSLSDLRMSNVKDGANKPDVKAANEGVKKTREDMRCVWNGVKYKCAGAW